MAATSAFGAVPSEVDWRPVSESDAKRLFSVAVRKPENSHFGAVIEDNRTPLSQAAIDAKLDAYIKHKWQQPPTNEAINTTRASLERVYGAHNLSRVEEWYSGNFIRFDDFDAKMEPPRLSTTEVELNDASFSLYKFFRINYQIKSITLLADPLLPRAARYLWASMCMEPEFFLPILSAAGEISPEQALRLARTNYSGLENIRSSATKIKSLAKASNPDWKMEVLAQPSDGMSDSMKIRLRGIWRHGSKTYEVVGFYNLQKIGGRDHLTDGALENVTAKMSYVTKRENFDSDGYPTNWTFSSSKIGEATQKESHTKIFMRAIVEKAEISQAFVPPSIKSHPDYMVTEQRDGRRRVLSKISPHTSLPQDIIDQRRKWMIAAMAAPTICLALFGLYLRRCGKWRALRQLEGSRVVTAFFWVVGIVLLITGVAKLYSAAFGPVALLSLEPVFGMTLHGTFVLAGIVEVLVSVACFIWRSSFGRACLLLWLATTFVCYRLGLYWLRFTGPCPCLGHVTDALGISPTAADTALRLTLALIFIGAAVIALRSARASTRVSRLAG